MNSKKYAAAVAAVTALGLAVLTACGSGAEPAAEGDKPDSGVAITHIHGVGLDPADGRLYVATHEGIVTPTESGAARRVGDSRDDFMGFTITGPNTFVASGHPGPGNEDEPANRGLIESTDAGRSWKVKSLAGEVDFHSLEYAHGTVYGYDNTNGLVRVSKDRENWDDGARLQALDLAVDPESKPRSATVLATTEKGVARSTDGGRTFTPGKGPVMAFLSWTKGALYGVDVEGGLHRSADGGTSWKSAGTAPGGAPQALTAVDADHLLVATQSGVHESKDAGKSFEQRLTMSGGEGH